MIVPGLLALLEAWRPLFAQARTFRLAVQLALATLCQLGRHTVSQRITLLGAHRGDWNRFYRFFSRRAWEGARLFDVIVQRALPWCPGRYLVVAVDDTVVRKGGARVPNVGYLRDPLSPKFRHNLVLGLRYLQCSLLLPLYETTAGAVSRACALPIRFRQAAVVRKPKASRRHPLTAAQLEAYEAARKANTLAQYLVEVASELRGWLDAHALAHKLLLLVVDNSYCNQTVFGLVGRTLQLLARARGNYRLYHWDRRTRQPVEDDGFTPEAVRKDPEVAWAQTPVYFGTGQVTIRYKVVERVVWPGGAGARVLRLIVIAATPYRRRKHAAVQYRQPGYLLTSDLRAPVAYLIQCYFDRWQIEVNHREEKTVIGVGQAQVHAQAAVEREPGFAVAAYSLLKWAALQALGPLRTPAYGELPAWYAGAQQPSCEDLLQKLRQEAWTCPEVLAPYGVHITPEALVTATRA